MTNPLSHAHIIDPKPGEFRRTRHFGGSRDPYGGEEGIAQARQLLRTGCDHIHDQLVDQQRQQLTPFMIGLAEVRLHPSRIAKSARPTETFTPQTCPVIGQTDDLGRLLVAVTPEGINRLATHVDHLTNREELVQLTSIAAFTLRTPTSRLSAQMEADLVAQIERDGWVRAKVRLPRFEIFSPLFQADVETFFHSLSGMHDTPYLTLGNFLIYAADLREIDQIRRLADLPFIDRVELMPRYRLEHLDEPTQRTTIPVTLAAIPASLPTIVIADSGIAEQSVLAPLVRERYAMVVGPTNPAHGTSVAALAAAQSLDPVTGKLTPGAQLVDVPVFHSADEQVYENELSQRLEDAVSFLGNRYKIWNLSFASVPGPRSSEQHFSELGQRLNELRERYGVMFVSAIGNRLFDNPRTQFPTNDDDGYVGSPGDTVRNLVATSLAGKDAPLDAYAKADEPSPFVGRGPGPAGMPLALLAEYGGNMTASQMILGVPTLDVNGCVCYRAGSSFTAPLISRKLAELAQCLENSLASHSNPDHDPLLLAKALLFHHAMVPDLLLTRGINVGDYFGFGVPPALEELIGDEFWRSTSVISTVLAPNGEDLVLDELPFPPGLRLQDYCRGDVLVTLVTEPLLQSGGDIEQVRSHVDLRLGPAVDGTDGDVRIDPNLLLMKTTYPPARFDADLIRDEQKWAPFRRYRKSLGAVGIEAKRWALTAHLSLRAEESAELQKAKEDQRHPQRFRRMAEDLRVKTVIIITISDPQRQVRVSDEMALQWQARGYVPTQIAVAQRVRARFGAEG